MLRSKGRQLPLSLLAAPALNTVLVANKDEDLIIRTDIIMQVEFLLDLNRRVISIGEEEDHPAARE